MAILSDNERAKALLQKYRAGNCTPAEATAVQAWFETLGSDTPLPDEFPAEQAVPAIVAHVMTAVRQEQQRKKAQHYYWLRAGVAALLIISLGALLYRLLPSYSAVQDEYATTARGEKKEVTLPDGSTVLLNAASELKVPSDYGAGNRAVWLTGEGFFSVKHDPQHPFLVHAGAISTRVLGTSFNVHAYPGAGLIKVAVRTGKVQVSEQQEQTGRILARQLTPDQMLSYDLASSSYTVKNIHADQVIAWKDNVLDFEEASIHEIATVLERHYNVSIEMREQADPACRYTIRFKNQPLSQVLTVLESLSGITYEMHERKIIVNPKNCY